MLNHFRSLRARLIVAYALLMALTVLLIGVPTVYLVDGELSRQVEARLSQGASASRALYDAELREMRDLVTLTSERPTLRRLVADADRAALGPYLEAIQERTALTEILVTDARGELLLSIPANAKMPSDIELAQTPRAAYATYQSDTGEVRLLLRGYAPLVNESGNLLGYLYEARELDRAFLMNLYAATGLYHNLLLGDTSLLSSVPYAAPQSAAYYTRRVAWLNSPSGQIDDVLALPAAEIADARVRLLQWLLAVMVAVSAGSALLSFGLARLVTAPLNRLVAASSALGRGDLSTPIAVRGDVAEIESLTTTLEQMRRRVRDAYRAVEESNRWHENLLASLTEGVFTVNQSGILTSFSTGATRIMEWQPSEVIGRHYAVVFPAAAPQPAAETPLQTTPGNVTRQTTRTRSGEPITLRITSGEQTRSADEQWEQAYVFRNVTEEEQATRLREYLLANVSHEFKTPLASLRAAIELLVTHLDTLSPAEMRQLLESAWRGILRLDELVENLIGSAALQTGHFPVHLRPTDLDGVIEEVMDATRPLLELRRQWIKVQTPSPLRHVLADNRRLHQVLTNLISNASKYNPPGAPLTITVNESADETEVRVSDRGAGVAAELRPYLFRPFARQGTSDQNGIGLGLSIVKAIVERHGGRVGMDDTPGGGATFWFTLPAAPPEDAFNRETPGNAL